MKVCKNLYQILIIDRNKTNFIPNTEKCDSFYFRYFIQYQTLPKEYAFEI